ncbi:hypothetical protein [Devosia faecipullorum]|uniref:hypothetical protein n=1 Tax=Devosia faecipullorum TaxID=2755039 RepID=UPI00187B94FF|nr:hypothetical protein [Devosia faecipullorum]MBE7733829.1 hypothetical protein [Devosia faecipullorum]
MELPEIERLIAQLLDTGEMNSDTRDDLERILAEARAGQSHADDLNYLRSFHARIFSTSVEASDPGPTSESPENLREEIDRLRSELEAARQEIARLETQLAGTAGA